MANEGNDLDIDVEKLLVQDRTPGRRFPRHYGQLHNRGLPTAPLILTAEERAAIDDMWSPTRPGFIELIRDVMGDSEKKGE